VLLNNMSIDCARKWFVLYSYFGQNVKRSCLSMNVLRRHFETVPLYTLCQILVVNSQTGRFQLIGVFFFFMFTSVISKAEPLVAKGTVCEFTIISKECHNRPPPWVLVFPSNFIFILVYIKSVCLLLSFSHGMTVMIISVA